MRKPARYLVMFLLAAALAGCSATTVEEVPALVTTPEPSPTQSLNGLVGTYMPEWSFCIEAFQADRVMCSVGYTVENPTDAPIEILYADVFAVVDGKIFKADSDQGDGVGNVSTNWNPGDKFKASTAFTVPTGATIQRVFFADDPTTNDADMIFDVGLVGISE